MRRNILSRRLLGFLHLRESPKSSLFTPSTDDPDNRFLVSNLVTWATPRTIDFASEQEFRLLLEPVFLALTLIVNNAATTNAPAAGVPPGPLVPTPVVPLGTNAPALTADDI